MPQYSLTFGLNIGLFASPARTADAPAPATGESPPSRRASTGGSVRKKQEARLLAATVPDGRAAVTVGNVEASAEMAPAITK